MKIVRLSTSTFPPCEVAASFTAFVRELEALSNRRDIGLAVNTCGGIVAFDPSRDRVRYQQNPCSGDLEPVIEEISSNETARSTAFDFKTFSQELRELSDRHEIKLVSVGALSGLDAGAKATTYLAIWSDESGDDK